MEPQIVEKLTNLWKDILKKLSKTEDAKKLAYFFSKTGIIDIDENKKIITLGTPNTFVETQIKKLFKDKLEKIIHKILDSEYKLNITTFPKFQNLTHPLLININELLGKKKSKKTISKEIKKQLIDKIGILFDKNLTFENFVVGPNNEIAYKAALKIAKNPGKEINPFFIRGDVGLGKTHLLQAIGNYIIKHYPSKVIVYFPTTKFIDEILNGLKKNNINSFFEKINQVDILILDDIQFLGEKLKTQEIFHNIFNDLYGKGKQIILSSDRPPKELDLIQSRLTSRFAMGMVCKIAIPDYITREKILLKHLALKKENIEINLIKKIASIQTNIRELLGILNNLLQYKQIYGKIDENILKEILNNIGINKDSINIKNETENDLQEILKKYSITLEDLKSNSRQKNIIQARIEFAYIAKNKWNWTLQKIGEFLGGKNHATILHYIKQYKKTR